MRICASLIRFNPDYYFGKIILFAQNTISSVQHLMFYPLTLGDVTQAEAYKVNCVRGACTISILGNNLTNLRIYVRFLTGKLLKSLNNMPNAMPRVEKIVNITYLLPLRMTFMIPLTRQPISLGIHGRDNTIINTKIALITLSTSVSLVIST